MAKIKKGKANILNEMNVEPSKIAKAVIERAPRSSVLDTVKEVLAIANEEPIKSLVQMGIQTLMSQAVPRNPTYHTDSTQAEKAIAPRSFSHEQLFKILNGYDEQIIAKVLPFMQMIPPLLQKLEKDPDMLSKIMTQVSAVLG